MATVIKEHYFEHNGRRYFRGNAENVELGSYGEKKDPIGPDAYLDVQAKIKSEHLAERNISVLPPVSIDWNQVTKAEAEANGSLNFFGVKGERAVSGSYEAAKSGRFKLVGFAINEGPLTAMLNNDATSARNYIADEGRDARVVSEVWVVMDGETADQFAAAASHSVSASVAGVGLEITARGGTHGDRKVVFGKGSTFAYLLHKVKDWNKGKTRVENMEADYHA